ncbi:hypothetical protein ACLOJK_010385 [Asimina triloba]
MELDSDTWTTATADSRVFGFLAGRYGLRDSRSCHVDGLDFSQQQNQPPRLEVIGWGTSVVTESAAGSQSSFRCRGSETSCIWVLPS